MTELHRIISVLIGFIVVLGFLTTKGLSIKCYSCNSAYDPSCGDPFNPYSIGTADCNLRKVPDHINATEATICRKLKQKVYGKIRVIRECGYIEDNPPRSDCAKRSGTHDVQVLYCACKGDLCNNAPSVHPIGYLLSASLIIAVIATISSL